MTKFKFSSDLTSKSYIDLHEVSSKDEDWKYTNISQFVNEFGKPENTKTVQEDSEYDINFNGNEVLSKENEFFSISTLNEDTEPLIESYYNRPVDRFLAQQYQKCSGGIVVNFKEDNEDFVTLNVQTESLTVPYIGLNIEANKTAKILINFGSMVKANTYPIIEVLSSQNSNLEVIIETETKSQVEIINSIYAKVKKDGFFKIHTVSTGAEFSRNRIDIDLSEDGAGFYIDGIYFGENDQIHDNRVFVNHIAKRTTSNMVTKGVLGDSSKSVFTGTIHIAEGAEKTESFQENRNILLSDTASAQSVPNLEILCDDVICGHGSSVGPIEENLYHYVMSRGIEKVEAEKLLIQGFFNEVINEDGWENISEKVSEEIMQKYMNVLSRMS